MAAPVAVARATARKAPRRSWVVLARCLGRRRLATMLSLSVLPAGPVSRGLGITVVKITGASLPVRENLTKRLRIHPRMSHCVGFRVIRKAPRPVRGAADRQAPIV